MPPPGMSLPQSSLDPAHLRGAAGLLLMQLVLLLSEQPGATGESIWEEVPAQPGSHSACLRPCRLLLLRPLPPSLWGEKQSACQDERSGSGEPDRGWLSAARSKGRCGHSCLHHHPSSLLLPEETGHQVTGVTPGATRPPCLHRAFLQFRTNLILTLSGLKSSEAFHQPLRQLVRIIKSAGLFFFFPYSKGVYNPGEKTGLCTNISIHGIIIMI